MVPFRKMHGLGNDFVVLDGRVRPLGLRAETVKAIADRLPAQQYRFSALVLEIVKSLPFQSRRAEEAKPVVAAR